MSRILKHVALGAAVAAAAIVIAEPASATHRYRHGTGAAMAPGAFYHAPRHHARYAYARRPMA